MLWVWHYSSKSPSLFHHLLAITAKSNWSQNPFEQVGKTVHCSLLYEIFLSRNDSTWCPSLPILNCTYRNPFCHLFILTLLFCFVLCSVSIVVNSSSTIFHCSIFLMFCCFAVVFCPWQDQYILFAIVGTLLHISTSFFTIISTTSMRSWLPPFQFLC